ncbi:MAG TPA: class I SAM-dependent methyltransferase [Hydrogenophaga sp.]|nr:class I SAM-dependent methyltransferase [Hydrogenophaga sp.]
MHANLSPTQIEEVRQVLLGAESDALIDLIFRLKLSLPLDARAASAVELATRLGWVTANPRPQLSALGGLVADPLREYRFWLDRDRRIHGERNHALLAPERYADQSVLEVGSGFGCNLLSLGMRTQGNFVGIEPMAIYRQFTSLLAEREGLAVPDVRAGTGEAVPFESEVFDIVLCYSAHQYMDVRKAIMEMARVLRPGGQLQIIGATLESYGAALGRQMMKHPTPSKLLSRIRTLFNTLSYQWLGRRLWLPSSAFATAAPIYPSRSAMVRWMKAAGLNPRRELNGNAGEDTVFVADKPARPNPPA